MIVLSVINNLKKKKSEQLTLNNNLMLFNLTKKNSSEKYKQKAK